MEPIFKEELSKLFKQRIESIKVSGLLHPTTRLHLSMTSLNKMPLTLETPIENVRIGFQPRYLKDGAWNNMPYRLDNSHPAEPLHTHWLEGKRTPAEHIINIRDFFRTILGTEFKEEDFTG